MASEVQTSTSGTSGIHTLTKAQASPWFTEVVNSHLTAASEPWSETRHSTFGRDVEHLALDFDMQSMKRAPSEIIGDIVYTHNKALNLPRMTHLTVGRDAGHDTEPSTLAVRRGSASRDSHMTAWRLAMDIASILDRQDHIVATDDAGSITLERTVLVDNSQDSLFASKATISLVLGANGEIKSHGTSITRYLDWKQVKANVEFEEAEEAEKSRHEWKQLYKKPFDSSDSDSESSSDEDDFERPYDLTEKEAEYWLVRCAKNLWSSTKSETTELCLRNASESDLEIVQSALNSIKSWQGSGWDFSAVRLDVGLGE
jgi:hypothetical protein